MNEDILAHIAAAPPEAQIKLAAQIHTAFLDSIGQPVSDGLHTSVLGRHAYYLAGGLDEIERKGESRDLKPKFEEIVRWGKKARAKLPALPALDIRGAQVSDLAYHASNRQGTRTSGLYFWVLAGLWQARAEGGFATSFYASLCPREELGFLARCEDICRTLLKDFRAGKAATIIDVPAQPVRAAGAVEIRLRHKLDRLEVFNRYFRYYSSSAKQTVHLVVYRPRLGEPTQFMKSFLAITNKTDRVQPDRDGNYEFTHVYAPPTENSGARRFSNGRVIALDKALYMIGEQRLEMQEDGIGSNLAVLCLPWSSLEALEKEFSGFAMMGSHDGTPIVSKIAIRVTSIDHSQHVALGSIGFNDLADDILQDQINELEFATAAGAYSDKTRPNEKTIARRIHRLCNNTPAKREVPPGYRKKGKAKEMLQDSTVVNGLAVAFGSTDAPKWLCDDEIFEFWETLRFPPLSLR